LLPYNARIVRCKTCHYSLANLTEHRCPECGTSFDPNDPATFVEDGPRILTLRRMLHILLACYAINLGLMSYVAFSELSPRLSMFVSIPAAAAGALIFTFPVALILYGAFWIIRNLFRPAG
jgi:hypothetical protein